MKKADLTKHYWLAALVALVSLFQAPFMQVQALKLSPTIYSALMFVAGVVKWIACNLDYTALDDQENGTPVKKS